MKKRITIILLVISTVIISIVVIKGVDEAKVYHPIISSYTGTVTSVKETEGGYRQIVIDTEDDKVFTLDSQRSEVKEGENIYIEVEEAYNAFGFSDHRPVIKLIKNPPQSISDNH